MTSRERKEKRYRNRQKKRRANYQKAVAHTLSFEEAFSFDQLNKAFYKCKKGVSWKQSIQKYEAKLYVNKHINRHSSRKCRRA